MNSIDLKRTFKIKKVRLEMRKLVFGVKMDIWIGVGSLWGFISMFFLFRFAGTDNLVHGMWSLISMFLCFYSLYIRKYKWKD